MITDGSDLTALTQDRTTGGLYSEGLSEGPAMITGHTNSHAFFVNSLIDVDADCIAE
jgi:hypothetical protein